ncbi:MAG: B12-binding domain-containing radical SAM protein [Oligoflexia bacterium]|nr:MAG: B12-binding domain-containing radical SAM protein [Oligoflexia bacterium]
MKDILLCTLTGRYHHPSLGLRYLFANLSEFQAQTKICEYVIQKHPRDVVEDLLQYHPKIVGFGVYIWNAPQTLQVISILKRVAPEVTVVVGGPEVSFEIETQEICQIADHVFKGESDISFYQFCKSFFEGHRPLNKIIQADLPDVVTLKSPYPYYTDSDIKHRTIYVEASRGCPFKCEYCLSSLDTAVRNFPTEQFLADIQALMDRGARQFKFVDRTFNLSPTISTQILKFFLDRVDLGLFLHFELVPDRLPPELKELMSQFPAGSLQFEIGIQTWNPEVAKNVSRRQDYEKIKENFKYLREHTKVHTHADLIFGLPGENLESFASGFDQLYKLEPDEIQLGILKRLNGAPISRHMKTYEMAFMLEAPYQILKTKDIDFVTMQKFHRFSQFWDQIANSGNFILTMKQLKIVAEEKFSGSLFWMFWSMTDFLTRRHGQSHSISLISLLESVYYFLIDEVRLDKDQVRTLLAEDFCRHEKRDLPSFLKTQRREIQSENGGRTKATPSRQRRHLRP